MNRSLLIALASLLPAIPALHAEETHDLLRFTNGDQLHGEFQGISEGPSLIWKRKDLNETAKFGINNLRHLVLREGNPAAPLKSISLVELVNGDQIPGTITALDEKQVTIESSCAGTLTIERNKIARIAPQPLGGRLHYHGPFSNDRWDVVSYNPDKEEGDNQVKIQQEIQLDNLRARRGELHVPPQAEDAENAGPGWKHSGAAWYWNSSEPGTALILRDTMPKRSTLRFDLTWKSKLNMAIAVHADFCVDKDDENKADENKAKAAEKAEEAEEGVAQRRAPFVAHDSSSLPDIFGNAFVLQIHSNYMVIYRTIVDDKGNKSIKRVKTASSRLRISENSTSTFELRSDLETSNFSLFLNGEFVTQWSDPALKDEAIEPVGGSSLAYLPQIANAQVRLTDIIIAEWNGMPDSARSLQVEDQDIILMTNGLDRLSGKAVSLEDNGMLRFKGKHGEFMLPLDDISELRMATNDRLKVEPQSGQLLKVRFSPMGSITGTPISGDRKSMVLSSQLAGDITIHNESAVMFEFDDTNEIFTDWDANF